MFWKDSGMLGRQIRIMHKLHYLHSVTTHVFRAHCTIFSKVYELTEKLIYLPGNMRLCVYAI